MDGTTAIKIDYYNELKAKATLKMNLLSMRQWLEGRQ